MEGKQQMRWRDLHGQSYRWIMCHAAQTPILGLKDLLYNYYSSSVTPPFPGVTHTQ